jgi:hypothetical protein
MFSQEFPTGTSPMAPHDSMSRQLLAIVASSERTGSYPGRAVLCMGFTYFGGA